VIVTQTKNIENAYKNDNKTSANTNQSSIHRNQCTNFAQLEVVSCFMITRPVATATSTPAEKIGESVISALRLLTQTKITAAVAQSCVHAQLLKYFQ